MDKQNCDEFFKIISNNKIVVWSAPGCGACVRAKQILKSNGIDYHEQDLSESDDTLQTCLMSHTRYNFIPQVFVDKKFIGGFTEVRKMVSDGALNDYKKI